MKVIYDTVRIISPVISMEMKERLEPKINKQKTFNMVTGDEVKSNKPVFIIGDYEYPIQIKIMDHEWKKAHGHPPRKYRSNPKIMIEASVHKALVRHNVHGGPKDIKASICYLLEKVEKILVMKLPPPMEWEAERVDIAENFLMDRPSQVKDWIRGLSDAEFPRREGKITRYAWGGLRITGRTSNINIYHKAPEFQKRDYSRLKKWKMDKDVLDSLLEIANRTIRLEVQIRKEKLKYDFRGIPKIIDLTDTYFEELYSKEILRLLKEGVNQLSLTRNHSSVKKILEQFPREKAAFLEAFWIKMCTRKESEVKREYPKTTFYHYRKILVDLGISWNGNDIIFPALSSIPPDFIPVTGNRYHDDEVLSEIKKKLKSYGSK